MDDIVFKNEVVLEQVELISRLINVSEFTNNRDMQIALSLINNLVCQNLTSIKNPPLLT